MFYVNGSTAAASRKKHRGNNLLRVVILLLFARVNYTNTRIVYNTFYYLFILRVQRFFFRNKEYIYTDV